MPITPNYSNDVCNIPNCERDQECALLCELHFRRYVTDDHAEGLIYAIQRRIDGDLSAYEKLRLIIRYLIHYATAIRIELVEHYPFESLFLHHFRRLKRRYPNIHGIAQSLETTPSEQDVALLSNLEKDFDTGLNAHIEEVRAYRTLLEGTAPSVKSNSVDFASALSGLGLFSPSAAMPLSMLASAVLIGRSIALRDLDVAIPLLLKMKTWQALSLALLMPILSWQLVRFAKSIHPVFDAAKRNELYLREADNRVFLERVVGAHSRLKSATEGNAGDCREFCVREPYDPRVRGGRSVWRSVQRRVPSIRTCSTSSWLGRIPQPS